MIFGANLRSKSHEALGIGEILGLGEVSCAVLLFMESGSGRLLFP